MPSLQINWRSGTLRRYESLPSVCAKFCYLNRVGIPALKDFTSAFRLPFSSLSRRDHKLAHDGEFNFAKFAKAIGEPLRVVQTISVTPFAKLLPDDHRAPLRYCPACIEHGYHGVFHQLSGLRQCLIHGLALVTSSDDKARGAVPEMHAVYFGEGSPWHFDEVKNWDVDLSFDAVGDCVEWLNQCSRISSGAGKRQVIFQNIRPGLDVGSKLNFHVPAPNSVSSKLPSASSAPRLVTFRGDSTEVDRLMRGFRSIPESAYLDLRRIDSELFNEYPNWYQIAGNAASNVFRLHQSCSGSYRRVADHQRANSLSQVWDQFNEICPMLQRIVAFREAWTDSRVPNPDNAALIGAWRSWYTSFGERLAESGLATPMQMPLRYKDAYGSSRELRIKCWRPLPLLRQICDAILETLVVSECWKIFEEATSGGVLSERADDSSTRLPDIWLEASAGRVRLHIWPNAPRVVPDWRKLDTKRSTHEASIANWEAGAAAEFNMRERALRTALNSMS